MIKTLIIIIPVFAMLIAFSVSQDADLNNPTKTIQDFYMRYLSYVSNNTPATKPPELLFSKSFGDKVKKNAEICAKLQFLCGWNDHDPYLDAQEWDPNLNYTNSGITIIEIQPNIIQVKLNLFPSEKNERGLYRTITYKMIYENGFWVVDDVMYSDGVSSLKKMTDEDEDNKKKR